MADFQQGFDFQVDGGIFAGIIQTDLNQAEQGPQNKRHQHRETGLFERQAVGERDIHRSWGCS
ncbi:hypothetical protein D3C84_930490 [compost metagenome]